MIITKQKPFAEIKGAVEGKKKLFLIGCGDCATLCRTGGQAELDAMEAELSGIDVEVTGKTVVAATCHELDTRRVLRQHKEEVEKAEGILVLTCGAGVQAVGDAGIKPVISGCDSMFIGNSMRQMHFYEKCSACGQCVLNLTGGLCPETRCPKTLLNGPCGGAVKGKCEVHPDQNCVWIEIYNRLKEQGALERLYGLQPPKDNQGLAKPLKLEGSVGRTQEKKQR